MAVSFAADLSFGAIAVVVVLPVVPFVAATSETEVQMIKICEKRKIIKSANNNKKHNNQLLTTYCFASANSLLSPLRFLSLQSTLPFVSPLSSVSLLVRPPSSLILDSPLSPNSVLVTPPSSSTATPPSSFFASLRKEMPFAW
jgi:hypothetical protein